MTIYKRYTLIVESQSGTPFPLEMLRKDSCVPARSDDVRRLIEDHRKLKTRRGYDPKGSRRVVLNRFAPDGAMAKREAWTNEGWTVVRDDADPRPGEQDQGDGKRTQLVR